METAACDRQKKKIWISLCKTSSSGESYRETVWFARRSPETLKLLIKAQLADIMTSC